MKKIIGIIVAGLIIITLFGNGGSRSKKVKQEAESAAGPIATVTSEQTEQSGQTQSAEQQPAAQENQQVQSAEQQQAAQENQQEEKASEAREQDESLKEEPAEASLDTAGENQRAKAPDTAQEESAEAQDEPEEEQSAEAQDDSAEEQFAEAQDEPEELQSEEAQDESKKDGISIEFKEAMDSYEAFFDEYAEFMKKFSKSGNAVGMMLDYSSYMTKYADAMDKLNKVDTEKLTIEEQKYYIEVMDSQEHAQKRIAYLPVDGIVDRDRHDIASVPPVIAHDPAIRAEDPAAVHILRIRLL